MKLMLEVTFYFIYSFFSKKQPIHILDPKSHSLPTLSGKQVLRYRKNQQPIPEGLINRSSAAARAFAAATLSATA